MNRREFIGGGLSAVGIWPLAHTPFPQWKVYRQIHLFIVVSREDPRAYELGSAIATTLAEALPSSRAQMTRAQNILRVASLISTGQLDVALISADELAAWQAEAAPFNQIEVAAVQSLARVDNYVLVSRTDFPASHAHLIAETLNQHQDRLGSSVRATHPPTNPRGS